jgi:4-amino-4-deoxy-L-arabinose transferase-like glycosyltransferase
VTDPRRDERLWLALLLVGLAPLLVGLGNDIQEFDPTQYAEAGRHIAIGATGWLRPHDNFGPYDDKPPMVFWLIALSIKALGATSLAVRLPSLLGALLAVAATFALGRELWDRGTGLLAAALVAASPALHLLVADPKIDAVVTAFMAWAVYFFLAARRRPALVAAAWLCVAGGLLTKGPIAVAAPLLAVLPEALRDRAFRARLRPLTGLVLVVLPCLPYALAAGPRLVYFHLWEQSFGRLTGQSHWRNSTGPFYFVHTALWALLPFAPALAWALWARLRAALRDRALPADARRVPVWWLSLVLLGISASSYKLPQYLYWLAPPAALLAARALLELSDATPRVVRAGLVALQLAVSVGAVVLPQLVLARWFPPATALERMGWPALCGALSLAGLLALRRASLAQGLAASGALSLSALLLFFHGSLHPAVLAFQPDRALGERARREEPGQAILPFVGAMPTNAAGFYARRDARDFAPAALASEVRERGPRLAVIDLEALPSLAAVGLRAEPLLTRPSFTTSKPTLAFLQADRRASVLRSLVLARVSLARDARATR